MARFLVKRLLALVATMLAASFLVFLLNEAAPGDVARKILGPYATAEQIALLAEKMGLGRPVFLRYGEWLGSLLSGDLGYSTLFKAPVAAVLWDRLANTGLLAGIAFALIVPLSLVLGVAAGMREASLLDRSLSLAGIVLTSIPEFASGVFLASVFAIGLGWLPGTSPLTSGGAWSVASQLVLPVLVIVLYDVGYVMRMVRASMVEVMRAPYVRTAVLKGLSPGRVIFRHALRNALIAPFTVILLQINYLIAGVVVVEAVFAYPGFGRMMLEGALAQDIALIEAGALVAVVVAVVTQALGDAAYMILNPRIRVS